MLQSVLEKEFLEYVEIGRNLPKQAPDVMLIAYGFYKQAIEGDIAESRPTENSDVVRTLMHDQWKRMEGMSTEEAMTKYVEFIKKLVAQAQAISKTH
jgi:acyl-CoA-binding protein